MDLVRSLNATDLAAVKEILSRQSVASVAEEILEEALDAVVLQTIYLNHRAFTLSLDTYCDDDQVIEAGEVDDKRSNIIQCPFCKNLRGTYRFTSHLLECGGKSRKSTLTPQPGTSQNLLSDPDFSDDKSDSDWTSTRKIKRKRKTSSRGAKKKDVGDTQMTPPSSPKNNSPGKKESRRKGAGKMSRKTSKKHVIVPLTDENVADDIEVDVTELSVDDVDDGLEQMCDFEFKKPAVPKKKSMKKVAIQAITAYLDAFQKIADAATNARGATKEIGTALTRICLRHRAVEARMKTFTSAIMDCLVIPLQEKLEDWKKIVVNLDKEHAKDYKRARSELKKKSTDTLRLQKKVRKSTIKTNELQRRVESSMHDVTEQRLALEDTEKRAVRHALVEERSRFCLFFNFLRPVVDEEIAMLSEFTHLQEAVDALEKHTADPFSLPPASEEVIIEACGKKCKDSSSWSFHTPPSSPSSLGSRKSSMCSISSLNSSSSGSSKSHKSLSQLANRHSLHALFITAPSRSDSGFISQDTLYPRAPQISNISEHSEQTLNANSNATWPSIQEPIERPGTGTNIVDRPHTISSAYEKGHQRPSLSVYTFQAPEQNHSLSQPASPTNNTQNVQAKGREKIYAKPPLPVRCSSLERPSLPNKTLTNVPGIRVLPIGSIEHHKLFNRAQAASENDDSQPTYSNMQELNARKLAQKHQSKMEIAPPPAEFANDTVISAHAQEKTVTQASAVQSSSTSTPGEGEKECSTSESSLESSSGYGSQTAFLNADAECIQNIHGEMKNEGLYSSQTLRTSTILRHGSVQNHQNRPAPPMRRTSSITNTNLLDNFPPPPAFLLDRSAAGQLHQPQQPVTNLTTGAQVSGSTPDIRCGVNVAETVKALTELRHKPASPHLTRRVSISSITSQSSFSLNQAHKPVTASSSPQPASSFATFNAQKPSTCANNGIYAQPGEIVRINPGSPSATRRISTIRSQSAQPTPPSHSASPSAAESIGSVFSSSFIAALSAKLTPSLSPRSMRRHSEDIYSGVRHSPSATVAVGGSGYNSPKTGGGFLTSLNAKLAMKEQEKAFKIRQLMNSKAQPDPAICHESLMDQIRRGATLRKAARVNDRSAPKIR